MYNGPVVPIALSYCLDLHATEPDGLASMRVQNRDGPDYRKGWTRRIVNSTSPKPRLRSSPTQEPTRTVCISIVALGSVVITNKSSYQTVGNRYLIFRTLALVCLRFPLNRLNHLTKELRNFASFPAFGAHQMICKYKEDFFARMRRRGRDCDMA